MNNRSCFAKCFKKCLHSEDMLLDLRNKNVSKLDSKFAESMGVTNPDYHFTHKDCLKLVESELE